MPSPIFISHSTEDITLVEALLTVFVNGIEHCSRDDVSTTTTRTGVKRQLTETRLVIQLMSYGFLRNHYCMHELTAIRATRVDTFHLLVPPLERSDLPSALRGLRVSPIDRYDTLDELGNLIVSRLEHCTSLSKLWTTSAREFEEALPRLTASNTPNRRLARRSTRRGSLRPV